MTKKRIVESVQTSFTWTEWFAGWIWEKSHLERNEKTKIMFRIIASISYSRFRSSLHLRSMDILSIRLVWSVMYFKSKKKLETIYEDEEETNIIDDRSCQTTTNSPWDEVQLSIEFTTNFVMFSDEQDFHVMSVGH